MDIDNVIKEAQDLLSKETEWKKRYKDYVTVFIDNKEFIEEIRNKFYEYPPLYFYILTTNIIKAKNTLYLDVRYRGQSVATLEATHNGITLTTDDKKYENNLRDFDCGIKLEQAPWRGKEASEFRSFFKNREYSRNRTIDNKGKEEHNVQSLLLKEFSKDNSIDKQVKGIQPVMFDSMRFGMPTPLKASNHKELSYAKQYGGEIDILARTGGGRNSTYLTVIEVKYKNNQKKAAKDALKQAIRYAVFIRELLRSESGKEWYEIFGFGGNIPKPLTIRVACAMPDDFPDKSFANQKFSVGDDIIECHYIYFKYDGERVYDFQTSLNQ
ncbi:MAG TPA: hypothetical protein PLF32_06530 [Bacteroidales bacterium]|nr:hypothetical protein [Bacteroidales bacterium]HOR82294.1 hypothetical protein [Bacteroidales bacterium]HPJ91225.1 hypothetical protein [Bacteroidales bacterium]